MINSMWSGVSGLSSHQTTLDVIGNDVANVNTTGFKQSNVTFQDAFYQSLSNPGSDTNGAQVGLGVSVGKIRQDFDQGMLQSTGVTTDLSISGDGFFVMKDDTGSNVSYTRAGDFDLSYDSGSDELRLLGSDGQYLYGTSGGTSGSANTMITLPSDIQDMMVSSDGVVSYIASDGTLVDNAFTIDVATFPSPTALSQSGQNQYVETTASGSPNYDSSDAQVVQGYLENSNVDLGQEFTEMIVAERGFQANSRTITTADSVLQELLQLKR